MNKTVKTLLFFLGVVLLGYGICILNPTENHNNKNSYITISIGFISLLLSLLKEKNK